MSKQFLGSWLAAGLAVAAFGACGSDDDDGGLTDAGPVFDGAVVFDAEPEPDAKPFCQDPIDGLDPACPEGGEVRMERVIGVPGGAGPTLPAYRVTSFLKSAQDLPTPAIVPPGGVGSCFVCDADSDVWMCKQAANRVYEEAGTLTISDGTVANDLTLEHCGSGTFAMGVYDTSGCDADPVTGIPSDAFARAHPTGAYIQHGAFAGTAVENDDTLLSFSFAGDAAGYPASEFDVYIAPDFDVTPAGTGPVNFNDAEDLVFTVDMPAATNQPAGSTLLYTATFIDTPPTPNEGAPVTCILGVINPGGGEQTFTIPAATVTNDIHQDGVLLRGAVSHVLAEYNDGTTRERRIDQVGMNCYSQAFAKNASAN